MATALKVTAGPRIELAPRPLRERIEEQQKEYALKCATNPYLRHYLFYDAENFVVGFSRLEWRDGYVYPTYGVSPQARGKGYAWEVVKHTMLEILIKLSKHSRLCRMPITK